jgi:hypothetical protein
MFTTLNWLQPESPQINLFGHPGNDTFLAVILFLENKKKSQGDKSGK